MTTQTAPKRYAQRDFRDHGTGQSFTRGAEITPVTEGQMLNYEAAGLAGDDLSTAAPATEAPKTNGGKPA